MNEPTNGKIFDRPVLVKYGQHIIDEIGGVAGARQSARPEANGRKAHYGQPRNKSRPTGWTHGHTNQQLVAPANGEPSTQRAPRFWVWSIGCRQA